MNSFDVGRRSALFFMHIPKTAGTSMRLFLADQYDAADVCPVTGWSSLLDLGVESLSGYKLVQGHFDVSLRSLISPGSKTLTILRNPLNRTLSAIRHMKRDPNFHPLHFRVKDLSVQEILEDPMLFAEFHNAQTGYLSGFIDPNDTISYLREGRARGISRDAGACKLPPNLAEAKANLERFDFVGVVEDMSSLLDQLCGSMAYHPVKFFRRDNDAPEGITDFSALTPREVSLLQECNDLDMELYDYARKMADERYLTFTHRDLATSIRKLCEKSIYVTQRDSFFIDIGKSMPGSGWYEPEMDGIVRRWTGPLNRFSLEIPMDSTARFRCSLGFFSRQPIAEGGVKVTVNGFAVPTKTTVDGKTYNVSFDIPPIAVQEAGGVCQMEFEIPGTFRPSDTGGPDLRTLGVLVSSVVFDRLG